VATNAALPLEGACYLFSILND